MQHLYIHGYEKMFLFIYILYIFQVYDPVRDVWEDMSVGLREGWTGSSVVMLSHLFVVSEMERMKVKVYESDGDTWDVVLGAALPEQICKPFAVSSHHCKIYVVGRNLTVAVGSISRINHKDDIVTLGDGDDDDQKNKKKKKWRFSVRWDVVDAPNHLSDLTPSIAQVLLG